LKKLIRKLIPVVLIVAAILPASSTNAAGDYRTFHPNQIVITENTPLYDVQLGEHYAVTPTGAALSPQVVTCTGGWNGEYFAVETWIGTKWVSSKNRIYGKNPSPSSYIFRVTETLYLYDEPFKDKKTELAIAPQDVESIDIQDVSGSYLLIHTWVGDKWINTYDSKTPIRWVKRWGTVSQTWIDKGNLDDPSKPDPNASLN
jgi:hypothetical protein